MDTLYTLETMLAGKLEVRVLRPDKHMLRMAFSLSNPLPLTLHWAVADSASGKWMTPQGAEGATSTAFENGLIEIDLSGTDSPYLVFVLFDPAARKWDNNNGKNFSVPLRETHRNTSALSTLRQIVHADELLWQQTFPLENTANDELLAIVHRAGQDTMVSLATTMSGAELHWGVALTHRRQWICPDETTAQPEGSRVLEHKAVRSSFINGILRIRFHADHIPLALHFVLTDGQRWFKNRGGDFTITLRESDQSEQTDLAMLMDRIAEAETSRGSWTLMHRYNLCHDLLDEATSADAMWLLFVWLRFSAIRQLDWQRNYNTKPRELSHAIERLVLRLSALHIAHPEYSPIIRMMLANLGRGGHGGEGQRIRDEILNIMHRHRIKEVSGHFLEEWHQKLHNNTTPDDVVICEAYIAFLQSDGNREVFYNTLHQSGVTRERLRSFERPIVTDPDFVPHLKDALIHDFYYYLDILKSIHSATDLKSALDEAGRMLSGDLATRGYHIINTSHHAPIEKTAREIIELRRDIAAILFSARSSEQQRSALLLDVSLEERFRGLIEGATHRDEKVLTTLLALAIENTALSEGNGVAQESAAMLNELHTLNQSDSLRLWASVERASRLAASCSDNLHERLQPLAESLGAAVNAEPWSITLFSEEIVRGRPAFVLSLILRRLNPLVRMTAKVGSWQLMSAHSATGVLRIARSIEDVNSGPTLSTGTILLLSQLRGDEEPPAQVTGIVTESDVDLVSHVAVRARNSRLLLASCFSDECLRELRQREGQRITLTVHPGGDVRIEEPHDAASERTPAHRTSIAIAGIRKAEKFVLHEDEFDAGLTGMKALNVRQLSRSKPESYVTPKGLALPFGTFEHCLSLPENAAHRNAYERHLSMLGAVPTDAQCAALRETIMNITVTDDIMLPLLDALPQLGEFSTVATDAVAKCIRQVWASKWTYRAAVSRATNNISHDALFMSVLIQKVMETEYAFVIHTMNPVTSNPDELVAEIVPGLGETIVGNHPGRALTFSYDRRRETLCVMQWPSKSHALRVGAETLIFRSDSNGEDLAGYAGAGLYDSVMLHEPEPEIIDYSRLPLTRANGEALRTKLLTHIAYIGIEIEKQSGSAQDIEGVYAGRAFHVVQSRPQAGLS